VEDEIGKECGACGGGEKCGLWFDRETCWKEPLGRPSCKYDGGVDWIRLIQERHKWRALVVPEATLGLPEIRGISRLFE
jgi:hypothetical protein